MKRSSKNSKSISSDNLKTVPVATAPDDTIGTLDVRDDQLEKAFRMYAPQYRVITPDRYVAMTVDMVATATTIIAGGTRIAPFGDEIRTLPKFDAKELVLDLANVGYAMFYANQLTIGATASRDFEKNVARATTLRERVLVTLDNLVVFGILEPAQVAEIRAGSGYRDLAGDLVSGVRLIDGVAANVRERLLFTKEEANEAVTLARQILATVVLREQGTSIDGVDLNKQRQQVFTFGVKVYDQARRAIQYLRFDEKDADDILPSLFLRTPPRRPSAGDDPVVVATPPPAKVVEKPADKLVSVPQSNPFTSPIPPAKNGGPFTEG